MTSRWAGHREHGFRFDLLTNDDVLVRPLEGVTGGFADWKQGRTVRGGGTLEITGDDVTVDWLQRRVAVTYWAEFADGTETEIPFGVFLGSAPRREHDDATVSVAVELSDKTLVLHQDCLIESWSATEGQVVTDLVKDLIVGAGETKVAVTDSPETVRVPMSWPIGTPKLQVCNELLASIEFGAVFTDGAGWFRAEPYRPPGERTPVWTFRDGDAAIFTPSFDQEADLGDVPNRVVCEASTIGDEEALVAVATADPTSPFSHQAIGRWVVRHEENIDATSQSVLQAKADRLLAEGMQVVDSAEFDHAIVPVTGGDVARLIHEPRGVDLTAPVTSWSVPVTGPGLLMSTRVGVSTDVADVLLDRTTPTPGLRFGVITGVDPIRVRLDGGGTQLSAAPTVLADVKAGDRVGVTWNDRQLVVLGPVGGTPTPEWVKPTLETGWTHYADAPAGWDGVRWVNRAGVVTITGAAARASWPANQLLFTLPASARPRFTVDAAGVRVRPDGTVRLPNAGTAAWSFTITFAT